MNAQIEVYVAKFKTDVIDLHNNNKSTEEIIEYIQSYPVLHLKKADLSNERVKAFIPPLERCVAKKSCSEQCTRRKKKGNYCGTHSKGTPHGIIGNDNPLSYMSSHKITIWVQNIQGILYYIDAENNVYNTEDILKDVINPKIIAKCKQCNDVYYIDYFI